MKKRNERCYVDDGARELARRYSLVTLIFSVMTTSIHLRRADHFASIETIRANRVDGYIRQRIFSPLFDSVGEHAMNDAMTAAEGSKQEERKEAQNFVEGLVELGSVSRETKGSLGGNVWDGGVGKYLGT
jgi:hypothetical protein